MLMCVLGHRTYFGDWSAPKRARGFCADQLTAALGYGPQAQNVVDDASIVVSELVTNAIRAGSASVELDLEVHHDRLRMQVSDDVGGTPVRQHPEADEEHGRGLLVVEALATSWGVAYPAVGKQVWAELAVSPDLTASITCTA
jgi:anti-sigma regulatory factor (Ser/Thr protein kinase)